MKAVFQPLLKRAASAYAAGEALDEAIAVARRADSRGYGVTLCYWHEHLSSAEAVAAEYLELLERLDAEKLDAHIAIKLPGLHERADLIKQVVGTARETGIPVDIDSHEPGQATGVVAAVEAIGSEGLGVAIPGRWLRSVDLAEWALGQGLRVRVVKGSWGDPAAPGIDMREGYLSVVDALTGRCREVAIATHDPSLAQECFTRLGNAGTSHAQELLYGYPMEPAAMLARQAGLKTRIYVPYGHAWVPYAMKRLLRNPRVAWWLAKDLAAGGRDPLPKAHPAIR